MKRAGALAAIVLLTVVPLARADGDPASDVLLAQDVYYTYAPPVSSTLTRELNGLLVRARAAGYPIKVALIESAGDLGAYPRLFGQPRRYAELLASEIAFNSSPHLLVVMPSGLAAVSPSEKERSRLCAWRAGGQARLFEARRRRHCPHYRRPRHTG